VLIAVKIRDMLRRKPGFYLLISLLSFTLVLIPYLYAAAAAGPEHVFGGFLLNPVDGNTYLAKMQQGYRGSWRFTLPYTAEPGKGTYLFLYYLFLGHMARIVGLPLVVCFHLARLAGAAVLLVSLAHFFRSGFEDAPAARLAFALAALGSGLGWLAAAAGLFTSDFWVAEAYPFLSAFANPHFPLGMALLLWLLAPRGGRSGFREAFLTAAAALILALVQPFGVVVALVVMGGLLLWEAAAAYRLAPRGGISGLWGREELRRLFFQALVTAAAGLPLLVYDQWAALTHPQLAGWNAQNVTPSPPLWDLLLSISPALLFALPAAVGVLRGRSEGRFTRMLLVWAGVGLVLLYLPFGLQRRFMTGLYVPAAGLGALGALSLRRRSKALPQVLLLLSLPTNLLVLLAGVHAVSTHEPEVFLTRGEAAALRWIDTSTPPRALVLAAPDTGLLIPAYTGRPVLYGHPFETVNAAAEEQAVLRFYQAEGTGSMSAEEARRYMQERGVRYVFWGPRERALGALPALGDDLQAVYEQDGVTIYAVEY